jgi:hypothetical protein
MRNFDITGKIGPMFPEQWVNNPPEWPMYSYERPAWILWNAIAHSLAQRGLTEEQIKTWLQSKDARLALDDKLGDMLRELGDTFAKTIG